MLELEESKYYELMSKLDRDVEAFIDPSGVYRFISPSYEALTGYSKDDLLRDSALIDKLIHPDDLLVFKKRFQERLVHQFETYELEFRIITRNSEVKWIHSEVTGITDENGIFLGYCSRSKDISIKKQQELELKRSLERQVFTLEMVQAFLHVDLDQQISSSIIKRICDFSGIDGIILKFSGKHALGNRGMLLWNPNQRACGFDLENELEVQIQNSPITTKKVIKSTLKKGGQQLFARIIPITYYGDLVASCAFFNHKEEVLDEELLLLQTLTQIYESTIKVHITNSLLKENETRLKLALLAAQEGAWEWDIERDYIDYSESWGTAFCSQFSNQNDSLAKFKDNVHPDDRENFLNNFWDFIEEKIQEFDIEFRIQVQKGEWLWVDSKAIISKRDANGKPLKMLGINRDISKQKALEDKLFEYQSELLKRVKIRSKELRRSEIYYETMIENLPVIICRWKEDTTLTYANPVAASFFGKRKEDVLGVRWQDLLESSTEETLKAELDCFKRGDKFWIETILETDGNGNTVWIKWYDFPIIDQNGELLEFQSIGVDVSGIKETQIAMQVAKEKAESADKLKTSFINNVSHELRTPLNAVIGFSELINEDQPIEQIVEFSQYINQSGNKLLEIVNDIINVTLIEADQFELKKTSFSLYQFLDEIYLRYYNHPKIVSQQLKLEVTNDLQEGDDIILCDQELLKKVFDMLLNNALKFTESGQISIGYRNFDPKEIEFYVKDTGVGIAPEFQDIIFNRFHQADNSTTRQYGGLGIGLYISQKIVRQLGGTICVESEPGCGSEFRFRIPRIINK